MTALPHVVPATLSDPELARRIALGDHQAFEHLMPARHCGLVGRRAGSVKGFGYSQAMKQSGVVWNAKTLDRFLANPLSALPGTTMTARKIKLAKPGEPA